MHHRWTGRIRAWAMLPPSGFDIDGAGSSRIWERQQAFLRRPDARPSGETLRPSDLKSFGAKHLRQEKRK
jgi:hypothetical protein